jgi:methionyl-tRNA formyltransferase
VGFAGTPGFAACALAAIHAQGCTIPVVLTQPDRPSGRGLAVAASAVKRFAVDRALPILQPASLKDAGVQSALAGISLDVLVVAAYGLILPQPVLDWPRHGCLNIHASLLPRWRGAAPIARAIEAGDRESGITIMRMDAGLDTGPIVATERLPVGPRETAGSLHDRLAELGARLIVRVLATLACDGVLASRPQPADGVTYAAKIVRADREIDWRASALAIDRKVRALAPAPGALAGWQGAQIGVLSAEPIDGAVSAATPGEVVAVSQAGIDVCCGDRTLLRLTAIQPASGKRMAAAAFAAGRKVAAGGRFTSPPDRMSSTS